jgi:hypothetical protein
LVVTTVAGQLAVFMQRLLRTYQANRWQPERAQAEQVLADELRVLIAPYVDNAKLENCILALVGKGNTTKKSITRALNKGKKNLSGPAMNEDSPLVEEIYYRWQMVLPVDGAFNTAALLSSFVKDVHGVWPKDTWDNVISGALLGQWHALVWSGKVKEGGERGYMHDVMLPQLLYRVEHFIRPAVGNLGLEDHLKVLPWSPRLLATDVRGQMLAAVDTISSVLVHDFLEVLQSRAKSKEKSEVARLVMGFLGMPGRRFAAGTTTPRAELYEHDPAKVGPRQDTHLKPEKVQGPATTRPGFGKLFVVESRGDLDSFVKQLGEIK